MKHLILVAALAFTGCVSAQQAPSWYESQGFIATECGPAVGAMVVERFTKQVTTRHHARAFDRRGVNLLRMWSLSTIKRYAASNGVPVKAVRTRLPVQGEVMIVYVDGNHFVMVERKTSNTVLVHDSMSGIYTRSNAAMQVRLSGNVALLVGG